METVNAAPLSARIARAMKVLPLDLGPIVGATSSTSVRLWGRSACEPTPTGPRRAFGAARLRPGTKKKRFGRPLFFKMNPNFDMTGVVVFDSLEPETVYEYEMGYFYSDAGLENFSRSYSLDWEGASRSTFRTGTDDPEASRSFILGSCRYLLRLLGGAWFDRRGDKTFESIVRQIDEGAETNALLMVGDQIYADDFGGLFSDELPDDYLRRYRDSFAQPGLRNLMSRVPTYMILDDHEIEDAWPRNATSRDFRVKYPAALHAYQVYQASHSPLFDVQESRIVGVPEKLWYRFRDGCCDFFVMDVRTERVLGEGGAPVQMVSEAQMTALKSWLSDGSGRVKLVVTSVPVFPETRGKIEDHWAGFVQDRDELIAHIVENGVSPVVFLSGDVHASMSAELRQVGGPPSAKLVSIVSSPFFWPYPEAPARSFTLQGSIRSGEYVFELAEAGPVHSTDNFTRVTVHPDRVEALVHSRKGEPLPPVKVHRFSR
jgi:alkaline phosphatase D